MDGLKGIFSRGMAVLYCLVFFATASMQLLALTPAQQPVDRIGIAGPVQFGEEPYQLVWTSHASPQYYKQEYLPAGQSVDHYSSMLMIDLITTGITAAQSAQAMVHTLEARKATDPLVNYDMIASASGDEIILDFLMSAEGADGKLILEWNAYRYSTEAGGVRMVGISRRAYGDDITPFLKNELRGIREHDIGMLSKLSLPKISIASP